ncbi:hypothetical protein HA402_002693 [Bradysia odoriphaga]|nr:hypothetical protein HA402_002693 [Bradysia odoriphaga]
MVDDIQVEKLAHVAYAYITISASEGSVDKIDIESLKRFRHFLHLRGSNPNVKMLISLKADTWIFDEVFRDNGAKLENLLKGLVGFIQKDVTRLDEFYVK